MTKQEKQLKQTLENNELLSVYNMIIMSSHIRTSFLYEIFSQYPEKITSYRLLISRCIKGDMIDVIHMFREYIEYIDVNRLCPSLYLNPLNCYRLFFQD